MLPNLQVSPQGMLTLTPAGALSWHATGAENGTETISRVRLSELEGAFRQGSPTGLLLLCTKTGDGPLPSSLAYWKKFTALYLQAACRLAAPPHHGWGGAVPFLAHEEITTFIAAAPPLRGMEFLSETVLHGLWTGLDAALTNKITTHPRGDASAVLADIHPVWRLVGRVTLHLAENKRSPEFPFAFLATYAHQLGAHGQIQHLPLAQALKNEATDAAALQSLLLPLHEASGRSPFFRDLIESRRVFQALAWTPEEAWTFLKSIGDLEDCGLIVKVPDWWAKGRSAQRPMVEVSVEKTEKRSSMGMDSLLKFNVQVAMGGAVLTPEELERILQSEAPLISLKGQWVEVDRQKLREALDKWQRAAAANLAAGIPFHIGLRLIAGHFSGIKELETSEAVSAWTSLHATTDLRQLLDEMSHPTAPPAQEIPGLKAQLRAYQAVGVSWLQRAAEMNWGVCLADDMGLGKTLQVLALLLLRRNPQPPAAATLLIVPASLLGNWRREIEKFAPSLPYRILHRSAMEPAELARYKDGTHPALGQATLLITTYAMASKLTGWHTRVLDGVILDEAQAIKNAGSTQTRSAKSFRAQWRLAMTGTPVENSLTDLWSLFDFLNPGLLGTDAQFTQMTSRMSKAGDYSPLRTLVRPFILRRMKNDPDIAPDLPPKIETDAWCHLTKRQATLYQRAVSALGKELAITEDPTLRQGLVLGSLIKLKQICNHPSLFNGDAMYAPADSGKFQRLVELCHELVINQERVLVFTQFRELTDQLHDVLAEVFRRPGLVLHGGTPITRRSEMVDQFQKPDGPPFFVISVKAGGTGLTLTAATQVIHFDRWWNPAVEDQATDRAYRIGQQKRVLVHKFICEGTLEERIDALIRSKKSLAGDILAPEEGAARLLVEMSNEELLRFVGLDETEAAD